MKTSASDKEIIELLDREVVRALGCTEPIAVALASAKARDLMHSTPEKIEIRVSGNILKNAMAVGIPGTGMTGLPIAAALGAIGGDPSKLLEVLNDVTPEAVEDAKKFVEEKRVIVSHKENTDPLYIECECHSKCGRTLVIINHRHTNFVYIEVNGEVLLNKDTGVDLTEKKEYPDITVKRIYEFATESDFEDIRFILEGAELNKTVAKEGLENPYGLQVGRKIAENIKRGILTSDIVLDAQSLTSSASDARMAGCSLPVMTNSGSGNQGITAMLPVVAVAEKNGNSEEELARALIISNLVTIHIKSYLGKLSALCGAMVAATGASAGITYLMKGTYEQIEYSIKNMAGGITGMICDGAKLGCALKISSSVSAAVQAALLAIDNIVISDIDGIIDKDIEKTIQNVAHIGSEGMAETDRLILQTMICK